MLVNELVQVVAENMGEGDQHPLAVFPAALPYFSVRVSAICVEVRELDVVQEFTLRAIQLGFHSASEIGTFLGAVVEEVEAELRMLEEDLFVSLVQARYALTEKGVVYLSSAGLRRTCEREAGCYINGVTRKIEPASQGLVPRRRLPKGTLALPPVPARAPRIGEIGVTGIKAALMSGKASLPRVLEISRLGRIIRTSSLFMTGHLLLRRGKHGVPIICAQGSPVSEYARILGGHPAIQSLKALTEAEEKRVRALIRRRATLGLNVKGVAAELVRKAVSAFRRAADADEKSRAGAQYEFTRATSDVFKERESWITLIEFHLLFAMWSLAATTTFTMALPSASPAFSWSHLVVIKDLIARGIHVKVIASAEVLALLANNDLIPEDVMRKIQIIPLAEETEFCGFSVDKTRMVLSIAREHSSSMGPCTTLFGVYFSAARDADEMLRLILGAEQPSGFSPTGI